MAASSGQWEDAGGGENVSVVQQFWFWGVLYNVYRKEQTRVRRMSGVTLATAQSFGSWTNRVSKQIWNGSLYAYADVGKNIVYDYSQIGDSNLYEVTETTTEWWARISGGTWKGA